MPLIYHCLLKSNSDTIVDQMLTDIAEPAKPVKLPPLVGNEKDNCGVLLSSTAFKRHEFVSVTQRQLTPNSKQLVLTDIAKQNWSEVNYAPCVNNFGEHQDGSPIS